MKKCPNCGRENIDENEFCEGCGTALNGDVTSYEKATGAEDVKDNKAPAIFAYLGGVLGIIVGYVAGLKSEYSTFHAKEALKIKVVELICGVALAIVGVIIGIPIAMITSATSWFGIPNLGIFFVLLFIYGIVMCLFWVVRIVGVVNAAKGEKKKALIVGNLPFL